jgi:putative ABC transport system permease protein
MNNFKQAIRALFSNPVRSGLTTLGIVIGISTVILVLSAGQGFKSLVNAEVETYGSNTLFAETRVPPTTKSRASASATQSGDISRAMSPVTISTFKNRDLEDIKRLPNVVNDYGMVVGQKVVSYQNVVKNVMIYGVSAAAFEIDKSTLRSGRFFTETEEMGTAQVAILGSKLADDLFGQNDPVNKFIRVGDTNYLVIGVYNSRGGLSGGMEDEIMYAPLVTLQKKMLGIDYVVGAVIQVKDVDQAEVTVEDIKQVLRKNHNITDPVKDDFIVQSQAQALDTFNVIFDAITILLIAIAAISLVVGGVGIMNIMYVVVTERTAEIGLKKALGAKNSDILSEFLMEAVLVTLVGGAVGILLGGFLGWVVSVVAIASKLQWVFVVPLNAIVLGLTVSGAIGLLFGVLPARNAAKLDPVEAMRHE